jgi:hypothetical protein
MIIILQIFFGPVKDVMPYLIRRAEENTSVAGQTSRELGLIKASKRKKNKQFLQGIKVSIVHRNLFFISFT